MIIRVQKEESRHPSALLHLTSSILHLTSRRSSLQLSASRTAALVATLASATLGDAPSPDAAAAACGSTFCQLTSSENWRLNLAATVQPSRLLPLAAFSISAVATFRVPRQSGDGYNAGGYIALWLLALRWCSGEQARSPPQSRLAG